MLKRTSFVILIISSIVLSACFGPVPQGSQPAQPDQGNAVQQISSQQGQSSPAITDSAVFTQAPESHSDAEHHSDVDLTHLEVGDGKYTSSPQMGYVYTCMSSFNSGVGGAGNLGNWMNGDGTWDATKKAVVDGSVTWPSSFTVSLQGDQRVFTGNDLPNHPTGNYPISSSDDAYLYDRNPNSIKSQSITLTLPANPVAAAQPNCVGGEVGIMLSGVVIFSAFDAEGRDAAAHEVQDNCDGHPQVSGFYHYHNLSDCIVDNATGHSALMGYAFDGYGIYGYYGEDGAELTNEDLDVCHGHTHMIEWDGQMVEMYHYHATHEFPYVVGCFHGTPAVRALSAGEGQGGQTQPSQGQAGQAQPPQGQGGGQGNGGQPPQAAIDACANLSVNAACTVNTPNGNISGTCLTMQNSVTACVPAGGPP
ncbi:MAG: YHYH protein [Anaerolineales bacterium]|nr:YHYH protein [Anaerolineales bacterium]